jgi:hypothetical protein
MQVPHVRFPQVVRSVAIVAVLAMTAPQAASAQGNTGVPQGNSALSQYLEAIPTASGSQPTDRIHSHHSHSAGSSRGGSHSGGGAGGTTGTGGGGTGAGGASAGSGTTGNAASIGAVSTSTTHSLSSQGSTGAADAAFARATAPSKASAHTGAGPTVNASSSANVPSPTAAVLKSLTGASGGGGLGSLLPAILIVAALATGVLALARRRTRRAGS